MAKALATPGDDSQEARIRFPLLPRAYLAYVNRKLFAFTDAVYGISAFALITLVVVWPDREGYQTTSGYMGAQPTLQWIGQSAMTVRAGASAPGHP